MSDPLLLSPFELRGVRARNRVMVSPMCMYSANDGVANDYHLVHLGRFALGGAGIVTVEATAVEPRGRITSRDLGLWNDDQGAALARVASFLSAHGAVPAIQLSHAGRKASLRLPWVGAAPLDAEDAGRGDPPWQTIGPSAVPAGPTSPMPTEMSVRNIQANVMAWKDAAVRATRAGFKVIELHGGHGYLLHSFQSPLSNRRTDAYGGDARRRHRFPLEVVEAVRSAVPEDVALFYRVSAVDGAAGGIEINDSVAFSKELAARGVDLIDTSSGGVVFDPQKDFRVRRGFGFHTPYSRAIRQGAGVPAATVGLIVDPRQAEQALRRGDADLIAVGREMLVDPNWAHRARAVLGDEDFSSWNDQVGFWLALRAKALKALAATGERPHE